MKEEKIELQVINHNCAGIDVGSRSHFVAIGHGVDHVEEYGIPKGSNRLKIAFRKGRKAEISATARKIGEIIYHMVTKKEVYKSRTKYVILDEKRRQLALIRKRIAKFGIAPNEIGVFSRPSYKLAYEKRMSDNQ